MMSYQLVSKAELKYARESIYDCHDYTCQICKINFNKKTTKFYNIFSKKPKTIPKKNIDHIIPRSIISWSHPFNLQLLCENCNADKGSDLPLNYWDVVENNIDRTIKWFTKQGPIFPQDEIQKLIWERQMKSRDNYYPFDLDKHYEVFTLYYDDEYVNRQTGVMNDVLNDAKELPNDCFSMFYDKIERLIEKKWGQIIVELYDMHNELNVFEKRNKAQNLVYWLKSLSYKLEVINQSYLVSKCDEFRNGIEEIYLAHRHVSR